MSAREKAKAQIEQVSGKVVRKAAWAVGRKRLAAKGAALEARGKARRLKERGKDVLR
ncbi:hypothetical protein [Streptomyces sp. cmx-4-9]|uniref:hypothetical protein n=1 Tax=Streptomyces sp. cmx-4-9 TaxID=2790941 RepID=UPI00398153C0